MGITSPNLDTIDGFLLKILSESIATTHRGEDGTRWYKFRTSPPDSLKSDIRAYVKEWGAHHKVPVTVAFPKAFTMRLRIRGSQ